MEIVRNFINNYKKRAINKPKLERFIRVTTILKKHIEPSKKNPDTEMNILIETYNKWFRSFPFDLPFFSPLKDAFAKTLPIMAGKMPFIPYLNEYYGESQTLSGLLDFLAKVTTQILDTIDTTQLVTEEYISNETKYNLDLYKKHHSLNQSLLLKQYSDGEKLYINTIKQWLENEKIFIAGILPFIKTIPSQAQKSKAALPKAFLLRGAENSDEPLKDFFDTLLNKGYIAKESKSDFIKAFSEKDVKNKILWIGQFGDLKSLILYLIQEEKIKKPGNNHWQLTSKLFTRQDGGDFTNDDIKDTKATANENSILELVQKL